VKSKLSCLISASALLSIALLSAARLSAQTSLPAPSGCGPAATLIDVSLDKGLHPAPPTAGKARLFYIESDRISGFYKPTTRVGLDGQWIGAAQGKSYFIVYIEPGQHKLCINWQDPALFVGKKQPPQQSIEFTAKAGESYYMIGETDFKGANRSSMNLDQLKTDEGEDYLSEYPLAMFKLP